MEKEIFGTELEPSQYRPERSVIRLPERTNAGNVALRIGRELEDGSGRWQQTESVVLTPDEARALAAELVGRLERPGEDRFGFTAEERAAAELEHEATTGRCRS